MTNQKLEDEIVAGRNTWGPDDLEIVSASGARSLAASAAVGLLARRDDPWHPAAMVRDFDPLQPRDPHTGKWIDTGQGIAHALKKYTWDQITELYGDQYDDRPIDSENGLNLDIFDRGEIVLLAFENPSDSESFDARILYDGFDPDTARHMADQLDWAVEAGGRRRGRRSPSTNGLVDWDYAGDENAILVGYDPSGDIRIGLPVGSDDDRLVAWDLSVDDAEVLAEALRDFADVVDNEEYRYARARVEARARASTAGSRKRPRLVNKADYPPRRRVRGGGGAGPKASGGPSGLNRSWGGTERKYNPLEPRNPHTGEWVGSGGAFSRTAKIVAKVFHFGDGDLDTHVDGDGVHLGFDVPGGGRANSGGLDRPAAWELSDLLDRAGSHNPSEDGDPDGRPHAVHTFTGGPKDKATGFAEVTHVETDVIKLELLDSDATLTLTRKEATQVADTLQRYAVAKRVETGNGPLDMFVTDDKKIAFRMKDDNGDPTEVAWGARDYQRIDTAVNLVGEGFDENDPDENAPEINKLTVKTVAGPVEVEWRGPRETGHHNPGFYNPAARLTITPLYDAPWGIAVDGDHMSEFFDYLGWVEVPLGFDDLRTVAMADLTRAAGHDVTPGHDELHHYWTRDPRGLAKWVTSPTPWTTLYHHLVKFVGPERAKRMAAAWFHERFGFWPGSDKNRVAHGKPPRGHKIGPG